MSMRLLKYVLIATLGALAPGCSESMAGLQPAPAPPALVGEWVAGPDDIGAIGWYRQTLTLQSKGRFASTSSSYGLYEGQERDDPSAWTRIEGTFRVDGNRLYFEPETLTWWDHFESPDFPLPRRSAYPWGTLFDDATFVVNGDVLSLSFSVSPADAPVPVTAQYIRR